MIYLVRHGQTDFNAIRRYQGQVESDLTVLGRAQARAVGARLAGLIGDTPVVLYASPLRRAQDTARIIAAGLPFAPEVMLDPRLMEVGMGDWDGLMDGEIEARRPGARDGLPPGMWFFHGPNGERYQGFRARLGAALARVAADPIAVRIVVSHGVAGRVLRGRHAGLTAVEEGALDVPQDAFFALEPGGGVRRIAA